MWQMIVGIYNSDPRLTNDCKSLHRVGKGQKWLGRVGNTQKCLERFVHTSQVLEYVSRARVSSSVASSSSKPTKFWQQATQENWFKPGLWNATNAAAEACWFQIGEMVKHLKEQAGGEKTFKLLTVATVTHWIDDTGPNGPRWSEKTTLKVKSESKRGLSHALGRPRTLVNLCVDEIIIKSWIKVQAGHSAVIQRIKQNLLANRAMGLPISNVMAQALIHGHLQTFTPEVLKNPWFKCLNTFVKWFFMTSWGGFIKQSHLLPIRVSMSLDHPQVPVGLSVGNPQVKWPTDLSF